ncbi:MAG: hypothetical protein AB1489_21730, partial [Acidobacteriota bacterium]
LHKNKIFLFSKAMSKLSSQEKGCEITCQIFKQAGSKFEIEEEINIPLPGRKVCLGYVEDLDPWSDNVLLIDKLDPPFKSHYLLFNLASKQMMDIGTVNTYAMFLKEDLLKH